jgi:hypothetical protein
VSRLWINAGVTAGTVWQVMAAWWPYRGLISAGIIGPRRVHKGLEPAIIMVSDKLTMIKDFLPPWFLSHTQGDRINRGGKLGLDGAAQAAC